MKRTMLLFFAIASIISCSGDVTDDGQSKDFLVWVNDPDPAIDECCAATYTATVSGTTDKSGAYYWLGLVQNDSLFKLSDSIYLQGYFENKKLSISVGYQDFLDEGDYELIVYNSKPVIDKKLPKPMAASSPKKVTVPGFVPEDCLSCLDVEITFRSFIKCQAVDGWPFIDGGGVALGFFSGDDRDFQFDAGHFRTSQVLKLNFDPSNNGWTISDGHKFGVTTKWKSAAITTGEDFYCPYEITNPDAGYDCRQTAVIDNSHTNFLRIEGYTYPNPNEIKASFTLLGSNPCATPSCDITAYFDVSIKFETNQYGDLVPYVKVDGDHDRYPWYELYVSWGQGFDHEIYTYDASLNDVESLCTFFGPEEVVEIDWIELY